MGNRSSYSLQKRQQVINKSTIMAEEEPNDNSHSMKMCIRSMKSKFPKVENVTTQTLYSWWTAARNPKEVTKGSSASPMNDNKRLILLDNRPDFEYDISHIEGAIRASPSAEDSDVQKTILSLKEHQGDQNVVCYCSLGYRSSKYAVVLNKVLEKEYPDLRKSVKVYNLEGSLFKWANEKRPMIDHKNKPTIYAHPYNFLFGKILHKELRKSHLDP